MLYRQLGNTGLRVSVLGCGTNRLSTCTQDEATAILNHLLDKGVNYISSGYGQTQALVGNAIAHRRDEFYISSKCYQATGEGIRKGVEESLRLLQVDHIDIYEMDYINTDELLARHLTPDGAHEALLDLTARGVIGHIGMTSHRPDLIARAIEKGAVETATFMMSFAHQHAIDDLLPVARANGVGTISIRPIDHGTLRPADRALSFAVQSGVDVTLSGMTSLEQVDTNVAAAERVLSEEEVAELWAVARNLPRTGCRACNQCSCPYDLKIGSVLPVIYYRERFGLLPEGEAMWQRNLARAVVAAKNCDTCHKCEPPCPYGVPISDLVRRIASSASPMG